jgi:hypothetical protein
MEIIYDLSTFITFQNENDLISTTFSPFNIEEQSSNDFFPDEFNLNITAFGVKLNYTFVKLLGAQNDYTNSEVYLARKNNATMQNFSIIVVS